MQDIFQDNIYIILEQTANQLTFITKMDMRRSILTTSERLAIIDLILVGVYFFIYPVLGFIASILWGVIVIFMVYVFWCLRHGIGILKVTLDRSKNGYTGTLSRWFSIVDYERHKRPYFTDYFYFQEMNTLELINADEMNDPGLGHMKKIYHDMYVLKFIHTHRSRHTTLLYIGPREDQARELKTLIDNFIATPSEIKDAFDAYKYAHWPRDDA